jgi:hypothetical protein
MKNLVRVIASYKDENGKFKGTQEFNCRMDTDFLLYGEKEEVAKVFQKMIDSQMVGHGGSFIFYSWAPVFHEPITLEADFEELWAEMKTVEDNEEDTPICGICGGDATICDGC